MADHLWIFILFSLFPSLQLCFLPLLLLEKKNQCWKLILFLFFLKSFPNGYQCVFSSPLGAQLWSFEFCNSFLLPLISQIIPKGHRIFFKNRFCSLPPSAQIQTLSHCSQHVFNSPSWDLKELDMTKFVCVYAHVRAQTHTHTHTHTTLCSSSPHKPTFCSLIFAISKLDSSADLITFSHIISV